jgi:hypothetical protein
LARKRSLFVVDDPHEETLWRTRNIVTGGSLIFENLKEDGTVWKTVAGWMHGKTSRTQCKKSRFSGEDREIREILLRTLVCVHLDDKTTPVRPTPLFGWCPLVGSDRT